MLGRKKLGSWRSTAELLPPGTCQRRLAYHPGHWPTTTGAARSCGTRLQNLSAKKSPAVSYDLGRGQDALGTAGGTPALTKIGDAAFLVFALSGQGRLLAAGFLRGDEIGVGILPEQE